MHVLAFAKCCDGVEMFMRESAPDEITMLIAESRPAIERELKSFLRVFKSAEAMRQQQFELSEFNPYEKIHESVYFAIKDESRALQLADMCTFFIRAHAAKTPHSEGFYKMLEPQMLFIPKDATEPA